MLSRAALVYDQGQDWVIEQIEVDPPKANEVLVQWKAAGLCHSDEHIVTGDMVPPEEAWALMGIEDMWPAIGGHEGAGVIAEVGPGVTSVAVGDHVSASFVHDHAAPAATDSNVVPAGSRSTTSTSVAVDGPTLFMQGSILLLAAIAAMVMAERIPSLRHPLAGETTGLAAVGERPYGAGQVVGPPAVHVPDARDQVVGADRGDVALPRG